MLEIKDLTFHRGPLKVLSQVNLSLREGQKLALLGSSGCGKTTLLRLIAGFEKVQAGEIFLNGTLVGSKSTHWSAYDRRVGFVFQNYALFPHLSVLENINYGVPPKAEREETSQVVTELMNVFEISHLASKKPFEISGGEQQRVAIVRALVPKPRLLLLDEPLAHLDSELRSKLVRELRERLSHLNVTSVLVTHSQKEAFEFCDELMVLTSDGLQSGSPRDVYENPVSPEVAEMTGEGCYFLSRANGTGEFQNVWGEFVVEKGSGSLYFFVRPENVVLGDHVLVKVKSTAYRGADILVEMISIDTGEKILMSRSVHEPALGPGQEVKVSLREGSPHSWIKLS